MVFGLGVYFCLGVEFVWLEVRIVFCVFVECMFGFILENIGICIKFFFFWGCCWFLVF